MREGHDRKVVAKDLIVESGSGSQGLTPPLQCSESTDRAHPVIGGGPLGRLVLKAGPRIYPHAQDSAVTCRVAQLQPGGGARGACLGASPTWRLVTSF